MYSTPNQDYNKIEFVPGESTYSTPCVSFLNETPKSKKKYGNKNNKKFFNNLNEDNMFYDSAEHKNDHLKIKCNQLFSEIDKENENFDNSVYFTPTLKSDILHNRTPLSEIKPSIFNKLNRTYVANHGNNTDCFPEKQVTFCNIQNGNLKTQNENSISTHSDIMNNYVTTTPNLSNSTFYSETENYFNLEQCDSLGTRDEFSFMTNNIDGRSNSSSKCTKRSWMKSTLPKKSAKRVRNRTLLQKILKLKILRRIPPTLPLHISFARPPDLVSGFTRNYSKKLNIFKRFFKRRNVQEKYYTKLRNRPSSSSSSGSNSNNTSSRCVNCCHHSNSNHILSAIENIRTRLDEIEKDMQTLKNTVNQRNSGTDKLMISSSSTVATSIPPLPPPPPPFPLFTISSPSQISKKSSASSGSSCSASKTNNKHFKTNRQFTITADDIKNVKLKKTPLTLNKGGEYKPVVYTDPRLPIISVDMLRSVKLKPNKARRITDKKRQSVSPYLSRDTSSANSCTSIGRRLTFSKENRRIAKDSNNFHKDVSVFSKFEIDTLGEISFVGESDC